MVGDGGGDGRMLEWHLNFLPFLLYQDEAMKQQTNNLSIYRSIYLDCIQEIKGIENYF